MFQVFNAVISPHNFKTAELSICSRLKDLHLQKNNFSVKISDEILRRRTFGIVSHPDAGKTTLTEKLLLFGGAIQEAGAVKSNKIKKSATSDFM